MRSRSVTVLLLFVLMFGSSSESHAFLEWLHKLSGPGPFVGARLDFRFDCTKKSRLALSSSPDRKARLCKFLEWGIGMGDDSADIPDWTVSLSTAYMWTAKNKLDYEGSAPEVQMLTLEPAVQFWIVDDKVFAGFGYAFNKFRGNGFDSFSRNAFVLRLGKRCHLRSSKPKAVEVGVKYLIFDEGFTPEDFGAIGSSREPRGVPGVFAMVYF